MAKKHVIIGILAMVAGACLAYFQATTTSSKPDSLPNSPEIPEFLTINSKTSPEFNKNRPAEVRYPLLEQEKSTADTSAHSEVLLLPPSPSPERHDRVSMPAGRAILQSIPIENNNYQRIKSILREDDHLWDATINLEANWMEPANTTISFSTLKSKEEPLSPIVVNSANIGTAYKMLDTDETRFTGLIAGGFSKKQETGLPVPEMVFGFQFEHEINNRNKIFYSVEFANDVLERGRQRVNRQAAWELLLDPGKNISLRTGVSEKLQKNLEGEHTKNLDYSFDVIWKF